jgi:hypothetical protein
MAMTTDAPASDETQAAPEAGASAPASPPPPPPPPPGSAGDAPSLYRPEGLPDHLAGKDERETIDKLFGAYSGLRRTMGDKPADAAAYALAFDEKAPEFLKSLDSGDPLIAAAREAAFKRGLTTEQFGVLGDVLSKAAELKLIEAPLDPAAEMTAYGGEAAYQRDLGTVTTIADTLKQAGKIDDAGYAELRTTATTAAGLKALLALRGDAPQALAGSGAAATGSTGDTLESLREQMRDPRYQSDSPKYDPAFRQRVYDAMRALQSGS